MSNYFGQLPPHFGNNHIKNNLVGGYRQFMNTNTPFNNNRMFMQNPQFYSSIQDPAFYQRINMEKLERMKKIKSVHDFDLSNDQLTNFVICPIKVERMDKGELDRKHSDRDVMYLNFADVDNVPQVIKDWWKSRNNTPYKSAIYSSMKKEDRDRFYNKDFTKLEDLIVHKVTQLDKDKVRLLNEYEKLKDILEVHNDELKMIYSTSEEAKHKEKFDYINKYKYMIKYDPKNYNDLKKFYNREQKKLNKENKRIDEMIELLLVDEQISKEDIAELQKPFEDDNDDEKIELLFAQGERKLEKQLEKQLKKEMGEKEYNKVMKQFEELCDDESEKPKKSKITIKTKLNDKPKKSEKSEKKEKKDKNEKSEKITKIKKVLTDTNVESERKPIKITKIKKSEASSVNNDIVIESTNKKVKIRKSTKLVDEMPSVGHIDEDDLAKYKNRKSNK